MLCGSSGWSLGTGKAWGGRGQGETGLGREEFEGHVLLLPGPQPVRLPLPKAQPPCLGC